MNNLKLPKVKLFESWTSKRKSVKKLCRMYNSYDVTIEVYIGGKVKINGIKYIRACFFSTPWIDEMIGKEVLMTYETLIRNYNPPEHVSFWKRNFSKEYRSDGYSGNWSGEGLGGF